MARTRKPSRNAAPALSVAKCEVSDDQIATLLKDGGRFDPASQFAVDLRELLAFAAFVKHERSVAPNRSQIRVALAELREKAASLLEALVALDTYSLTAFNRAYVVAMTRPRAAPGDLLDQREAISQIERLASTIDLSQSLLAEQTTTQDRVVDRWYLGRALFDLHRRNLDLLPRSMRKFVVDVLKQAKLTFPDPITSRSAFDEAIFGSINGEPWLTWARRQHLAALGKDSDTGSI